MCQSSGNGLLVLSEIYYKPGWTATVNGNETTIYQTNHVLRSVKIPSGESEVIFEYNESNWKNMRMLSRFSLMTLLIILALIYWKERV